MIKTMKQEIKVGDSVKGHFSLTTNRRKKIINWEGVVCGKKSDTGRGKRTSDILVKVQGIGEPFWVMRNNVERI